MASDLDSYLRSLRKQKFTIEVTGKCNLMIYSPSGNLLATSGHTGSLRGLANLKADVKRELRREAERLRKEPCNLEPEEDDDVPRITHVKAAQRRYETEPVMEDGKPKRTPVMLRSGSQKTNRRGEPVFRTVTRELKNKPLPPEDCDYCGEPIAIGKPYKHITPRNGPHGGTKRSRHENCPDWHEWDYSNSLAAQANRINHGFHASLNDAQEESEVREALETMAEAIRELAAEKQQNSENMEESFGHPVAGSVELSEQAELLDMWADEIESATVPDLPEDRDEDDWLDNWRDDCRSELAVVDEIPV